MQVTRWEEKKVEEEPIQRLREILKSVFRDINTSLLAEAQYLVLGGEKKEMRPQVVKV